MKPWLKASRRLFGSLVFVYIVFVALLFFIQRSQMYFPDKAAPQALPFEQLGYAPAELHVTTKDNFLLSAWFYPPEAPDGKILLYFHGNGGSIAHRQRKILPYLKAGHGVLLAEYRGYGGNPGQPNEQGFYADGRAYYDWLLESGYKPENLVIYGESIGTGVAVQMAVEYGPSALILETPYASAADAARHRFFFIPFLKFLVLDRFASDEKIQTYHGKKLFLIAGRDEVIGPDTGQRLYEIAQEPKSLVFIKEATHNTMADYDVAAKVLSFLTDI